GLLSCSVGSLAAGGSATITVTLRPTATGTVTEAASVAGNETDSNSANDSSSKTTQVVGFAPGGGAFVIGDRSVDGTVTFWSPMWWRLSGRTGSSASSSSKGFAFSPASPTCGSAWSTAAGSSPPPPPGPLPAAMAVIATGTVTQSRKSIGGTVVHIVVVSTN